jgi:hypothetical protein
VGKCTSLIGYAVLLWWWTTRGQTGAPQNKERGTRMAQQQIITIVDDLDGSTTNVKEGVTFWLDGTKYEIDLGEDNLEELEGIRESYQQDLQRFVEAGRKVKHDHGRGPKPGRKAAGGGSPAKVDPEQNHAIRAWWRSQGNEISDRGRIPAKVLEAFHKEQ